MDFRGWMPPEIKIAAAIIGMLVALIITLLLYVGIAHASPSCMTHGEAKRAFHGAHLYWYGSGHCWSNRRGGPRKHEDPPPPKERYSAAKAEAKGNVLWPQPLGRRFTPWEERISGAQFLYEGQ